MVSYDLQISLRELEVHLLAGELLVDGGEGLHLVFNVSLLALVQMTFEQARSIQLDPDPLANNLCWVDQVIKDGIVNSLKSSGPGSLLLQLVGLPGGLGQDGSLGNEHHMLATELFLQLANQPKVQLTVRKGQLNSDIPTWSESFGKLSAVERERR